MNESRRSPETRDAAGWKAWAAPFIWAVLCALGAAATGSEQLVSLGLVLACVGGCAIHVLLHQGRGR